MTSAHTRRLPEHGQLAEINPASDTGQRWWHGQHSFVRRSHGGFDPDRYDVTPISDPVAKSYVTDCALLVNDRSLLAWSGVAADRK